MRNQEIRSKERSPEKRYSESFKKKVVHEYERGFLNKDEIQLKYGIGGNSRVLEWCQKYGKLHYPLKGTSIGRPMKDPEKRHIKALEIELKEVKLKLAAYEKLIAITEQQENISIIKKDAVKQLVSLPKPTPEK